MNNNFSGPMYSFEPKIPIIDQLLKYIEKAKNKLQIIPDTILLPLALAEINMKIDGFTLIYRKYIQNGHCWIGKA
jgi:hypothetical protein